MNGLQRKLTGGNCDNAGIPLANNPRFLISLELFDFSRESGSNSQFNLPPLLIDVDLLLFLRPIS